MSPVELRLGNDEMARGRCVFVIFNDSRNSQ